MQECPPQKAGDKTTSRTQRKVGFATFRFATRPRFDLVRPALLIAPRSKAWIRRRATAGIAAVILGLADGRGTNSNTPSPAPRWSGDES